MPIDRLHYNANFQSPGLLPWMGSSLSGPVLPLVLAVFALGCGAIWLSCRPDRAGRLWLVTGTWMSFVSLLALGAGAVAASDSASHSFSDRGEAWVEQRRP